MALDIQKFVSMRNFTSWQVGGEAEYFCLPSSVEEIKFAQEFAQKNKLPMTIIGGGSNILVSDQGIAGLTICMRKFKKCEARVADGRLLISAEAGVLKIELLKIFLKYKLDPALFLAGLPGDIGGGIVMNAGVAEKFVPREFVEIIDWVEVLRPGQKVERLSEEELHWSYRHCEGWQPGIIIRAQLSWPNQTKDQILNQVKEANQIRLRKQPLDLPSCGSVFVNTDQYKAAQVIDRCGLKGYTIGGAQVSTKHANFIVNLGTASATDIWKIISHIRSVVLDQAKIDLKTEVKLIGNWPAEKNHNS